jgi:hypothetical protein
MTYHMRGPLGDPRVTVGVAGIGGAKSSKKNKEDEASESETTNDAGEGTSADGGGS